MSALGSAPPTVRADLAVALRLPVPRTTGLVLWRPAPRPPVARAQAAAAVVGGRMWLAGGAVPSQRGLEATGRVERFDPRGASWRIAAPLPLPLRAAMAAAWRGAPVVLGGTSPGASARGFVSARVLILRNGVWTDLAPLPEPRSAGGAATVGGRIVVAGGDAYGRPVAATDVFDGTRWRRGAPIPVPRSRPAVVTDGRHVYVLGGEDPATGAASDRVDRYDPATDRWLRLPDLPVPVAGAGATFGAGKLFVAGGERASGLTGAAEVYNLAEHRWGPLQPLATGRGALALATLGRTLYAVGGTPSGSPSAATAAAEALVLP